MVTITLPKEAFALAATIPPHNDHRPALSVLVVDTEKAIVAASDGYIVGHVPIPVADGTPVFRTAFPVDELLLLNRVRHKTSAVTLTTKEEAGDPAADSCEWTATVERSLNGRPLALTMTSRVFSSNGSFIDIVNHRPAVERGAVIWHSTDVGERPGLYSDGDGMLYYEALLNLELLDGLATLLRKAGAMGPKNAPPGVRLQFTRDPTKPVYYAIGDTVSGLMMPMYDGAAKPERYKIREEPNAEPAMGPGASGVGSDDEGVHGTPDAAGAGGDTTGDVDSAAGDGDPRSGGDEAAS